MEFLQNSHFLTRLLHVSWQASVLILIVLAIQWLFKKQLPSRWRYGLWLIVVLRLALPVSLPSVVSVFNMAKPRPLEMVQLEPEPESPVTEHSELPQSVEAGPGAATTKTPVSQAPLTKSKAPNPAVPAATKSPSLSVRQFWKFLPLIWCVVAALLVLRIIIQIILFDFYLRGASKVLNNELIDLFEDCKHQMGVSSGVALLETDMIKSPAVYGFLRPKILVPRSMLRSFELRDLRYVFLHELGHIKRRDMIVLWSAAILQVLHWFNPMVWFAFYRMNADRELACDELVLNVAEEGENKTYGEAIIRLLETLAKPALPGLVGILEDKGEMERRIRLIASFKRTPRWPAFAIVLVAVVALITLTDAQTEIPTGRVAAVSKASVAPVPLSAPVAEPTDKITYKIFSNSLGMKFVAMGSVQFSIWETRVQDFEAFVRDSGYDCTIGGLSTGSQHLESRGRHWKDPGFEQGPAHPVCLVSWEDADAFCRWLTAKEMAEGLLKPNQFYRLPTSKEWLYACGTTNKYLWGNDWPPPPGSGNFAGTEALQSDWPMGWSGLTNYTDPFPRTAPVGSFTPNRYGIFDLSGNVWEWCYEWHPVETNVVNFAKMYPGLKWGQEGVTYRTARGGGWVSYSESGLLRRLRRADMPHVRLDTTGFRCVLVTSSRETRTQRNLSFQLVDARSGVNISQRTATISFSLNERGRSAYTKQTDGNGGCAITLTGESPGSVSIIISAPGFLPQRFAWAQSGEDFMPQQLTVKMETALRLSGVVKNHLGEPVQGASISLVGYFSDANASTPPYAIKVFSDEQGRWFCDQVPSDWGSLKLVLQHPRYAPSNLETNPELTN